MDNVATPEGNSSFWARIKKNAAWYAIFWLILVFFLIMLPTFQGLKNPDAMKYADVARSITRGDGAYSQEIFPLHLIEKQSAQKLTAEQIRIGYVKHFMYPLVLAIGFSLLPVNDFTVLIVSSFFWLVAGMLVFFLTRELFAVEVGLLATAIYSLQPKMIAFAVGGLSEPLCVAVLLVAALCLLREKHVWLHAALAGAVFCLSLYIRQPMLFLIPVVWVGFLFFRTRRLARIIGSLTGFIIVFLLINGFTPLLFPPVKPVENHLPSPALSTARLNEETTTLNRVIQRLVGKSYLIFSEKYPGHAYERSVDFEKSDRLSAIDQIHKRVGLNLILLSKVFAFKIGSPLFGFLFVFAILLSWPDKRARLLSLIALALLLATAGTCLLLFVMDRYFQLLIPFMVPVIAWAWLSRLAKIQRSKMKYFFSAAVALALMLPLPFAHLFGTRCADQELRALYQHDPRLSVIASQMIRQNTSPEEPVLSDLPWLTAWYADRASIWVPLAPQDAALVAEWIKVEYLFLSMQEPQGFMNWRAWLMAMSRHENNIPLHDWKMKEATLLEEKGIYLFSSQ